MVIIPKPSFVVFAALILAVSSHTKWVQFGRYWSHFNHDRLLHNYYLLKSIRVNKVSCKVCKNDLFNKSALEVHHHWCLLIHSYKYQILLVLPKLRRVHVRVGTCRRSIKNPISSPGDSPSPQIWKTWTRLISP